MINIKEVKSPGEKKKLEQLLKQYTTFIKQSLLKYKVVIDPVSLEGLNEEDNNQVYGQSNCCFLIAYFQNRPAGCGAIKRIRQSTCEMKRLFVRPELRGKGIGRFLVESLMDKARDMDYRFLRLSTHSFMDRAVKVYRMMGFYPIDQYHDDPLQGDCFFEIKL